jgi:hypothetical protein
MPKPDEVQAALDVLYLSKNLNWEFEQRMWKESKSKLDYTFVDRIKQRLPSRYSPGWAKGQFDQTFRELITLALEQAEKVRKGKSAQDIYPLTACVVQIQSDHYGVELYLGKAGVHMKDGFKNWHSARWWATYDAEDYLREKGVPEGEKLNIVGKEYW